jgi:hypothetical protein
MLINQSIATGEKQVSLTRRQCYLGAWLLIVALWCGACSSQQAEITAQPSPQDNGVQDERQDRRVVVPSRSPSHGFDKTEVDLEYGPLEPASRYHRPRQAHIYTFDKTETDLTRDVMKRSPSQPR